jgi:hypothetical protein
MNPVIREMTIVCAPGSERPKPMIRIANKQLEAHGFPPGTSVIVEYRAGIITITKKS